MAPILNMILNLQVLYIESRKYLDQPRNYHVLEKAFVSVVSHLFTYLVSHYVTQIVNYTIKNLATN
jgi:hypothetical protein